MNPETPPPPETALELLLKRSDVWRGHAHHFAASEPGVSSGFEALDGALMHRGWPRGALIEICQDAFEAEWTLLGKALQTNAAFTVLLNPPSQPFVQFLLQQGVDLKRLVIVESATRSDFIGC